MRLAPGAETVLIVNTKSRRGQEWFEHAQVNLRNLGVNLLEAHAFRTVGPLIGKVQDAVRRKVPLVIVGGGDGTFSAVARYFMKAESVLGVLPLGTGNAFARDLGIVANLDQACEIIAGGRIGTVDVGTVADDYFLNVATVGLTTQIAQSLTDSMKRRYGRFVYAIAMSRALSRVHPFHVEIETENGIDAFDTLQVVVGNGRYHAGPFPLSPTASITEGHLTIYALDTVNRAAFFKLALFLPTGRHVDLPEVHAQEARSGIIRTSPVMPVTVDGEVCSSTPMHFGIAPDVLKVIVPEEFPG